MPLMEWNDAMSVRIASIDKEHRQLVDMLNELYDGFRAGQGKEALAKTLDSLVTYTGVHFRNEEGYFERTGYPETIAHKKEHEALLAEVRAFQTKYKTEATSTLTVDMLTFLKNWLLDHIQGSDKAYADHLIANGIR